MISESLLLLFVFPIVLGMISAESEINIAALDNLWRDEKNFADLDGGNYIIPIPRPVIQGMMLFAVKAFQFGHMIGIQIIPLNIPLGFGLIFATLIQRWMFYAVAIPYILVSDKIRGRKIAK